MLPSLVTWPTSTVVMLRSLAIRISAAATSLTWVTPPGTPSTSAALMVWTESITSSVGRTCLDVAEHGAEIGLGREVELVLDAAGAVGAQPHLGRGLLAGDVERAVPQPRGLGGHLEQQRGLADARLTGEQDRGAGDQAAAEHPVELGHAAGARLGVLDRHLADRHAPARSPARPATRLSARPLRDRAPGLALAAAADPLARLPAALVAVVAGRGPCRVGFAMASNLGEGADRSAARRAGGDGRLALERSHPGETMSQPTSAGRGRPGAPPRASDAGHGRRRARRLPADGLQRAEQPRAAAPRDAPARAVGDRRGSATRPTGPPGSCAPAPRT